MNAKLGKVIEHENAAIQTIEPLRPIMGEDFMVDEEAISANLYAKERSIAMIESDQAKIGVYTYRMMDY